MTIYRNPELWVDYFNGIYIKPAQEDPSGEGNLFATNLAESGLLMYTRSRNRTDPTLTQDTITASYLFLPRRRSLRQCFDQHHPA